MYGARHRGHIVWCHAGIANAIFERQQSAAADLAMKHMYEEANTVEGMRAALDGANREREHVAGERDALAREQEALQVKHRQLEQAPLEA